jgi:hypothetical protein
MTTFNNDPENHVPVTKENLAQFREEYSPDFVQGYLQAMQDYTQETKTIVFNTEYDDVLVPNSAYKIKNQMIQFHLQKRALIKEVALLDIKPSGRNNSTNFKKE